MTTCGGLLWIAREIWFLEEFLSNFGHVLQDMLLLACTHSENRTILMTMPEWPEWLLEILLSNYEV